MARKRVVAGEILAAKVEVMVVGGAMTMPPRRQMPHCHSPIPHYRSHLHCRSLAGERMAAKVEVMVVGGAMTMPPRCQMPHCHCHSPIPHYRSHLHCRSLHCRFENLHCLG